MEQSIELMRRRHAYYTKLIANHNIHTAQEFCDIYSEIFEMFGVELYIDADATNTCIISITCEGYDYEDYTIQDGVDNGLATVSNIVEWKPVCCHEATDIFS